MLFRSNRINQLDGRIRQSKENLYALLAENDTIKKDSLINVLATLHKEIEETHYKHFNDIKSICKPEQQVYFKQLIVELPSLFGSPKQLKPDHEASKSRL